MNIFFSSIANLKRTLSDKQMYPRWGTPCVDCSETSLK